MQRKCIRGVAVDKIQGQRWSLAVAFWLGTLGLAAQESRPSTQGWQIAHAQWSERSDDLVARLGDDETTFKPAQQWQHFVIGNADLAHFATLLLPNGTDLAIAGDADLYLRCLHGPPTDALLKGLLAPAPTPSKETRRKQIDRLMAMRLVVDEARGALLPDVRAIATGTDESYDEDTRRTAGDLLNPRTAPFEAPPLVSEIARLPAGSEIVIASDGLGTPRLRHVWRAYRDLGRHIMGDLIRRAGGTFPESSLAHPITFSEPEAIVMPLVVARAGTLRLQQACTGMQLAALQSASVFELPGFCGIWNGEFDRDALVSYAERLAEHSALASVTTVGNAVTQAAFDWQDSDGAHKLDLRISITRIEVRTSRQAAPLGPAAATALVARWDELMPGTGGLRAHANLPRGETLDVGVQFASASVRVVSVLECRDAETAAQRLVTIRAFLDDVRSVEPASGGVGTPPNLLVKVALHEFGEPKLTQEGPRIRVVIEANGSFDDLVTQWVADIGTLLASVK